jgi:hypothetical protein
MERVAQIPVEKLLKWEPALLLKPSTTYRHKMAVLRELTSETQVPYTEHSRLWMVHARHEHSR